VGRVGGGGGVYYNDQNSHGQETQWLGSSTGGDNMTAFQAWELTSLFPLLGNRLCPTAKLVFHVGIAFVKCERVNNSISPDARFMESQTL
jgi:hypothetical protein